MFGNLFLTISQKYLTNISGQFGVWFAILAVPVVGVTTFAIDYRKSIATSTRVSDALDSAALAAVTHQTLSVDERAAYATNFFWNLIPKSDNISFSVATSTNERVELLATSKTPTSVMRATGVSHLTSKDIATAVLTKGDVVCALALDPIGKNAFEITQGGSFSAPTCSVQVNSTHPMAATVELGGQATAKDFCVSGGASGTFFPHVNTECSPVADPYVNKTAPLEEPCLNQKALKDALSHWHAVSVGITLSPGTYCGGLNLQSNIITLLPGAYVIKDGPLILNNGSKVKGEGISFIMSGEKSVVNILNGSTIDVSAPKTGPLAGLAVFQQTSTKPGSSKAKRNKNPKKEESVFESGANMRIVGTVYLPEQNITFVGGSMLASQAPATSFIAHNIKVTHGANIEVAVDHRAAGLPPLEPRSDESARLIR